MKQAVGTKPDTKVINRERAQKAAEDIDRLRKKVPGFNSVEELRRWRERGRDVCS